MLISPTALKRSISKFEIKDEYLTDDNRVTFRVVPEKTEYNPLNDSRTLTFEKAPAEPIEKPTEPTVTSSKPMESKPTEPTATSFTATETKPTETTATAPKTETQPTNPDEEAVASDLNNDGEVNVKDADLIFKFVNNAIEPTA